MRASEIETSRPKRPRLEIGEGIENEMEPSVKRTARACDTCRAKKNKCDGGQPSCISCVTAGLPCSYGTKARKRGLPTGYVRILETLWALVFEAVPGAAEATLELLRASWLVVDGDDRVTLSSNIVPSGQSLRKVWSESPLRFEIERLIREVGTNQQLVRDERRSFLNELPTSTSENISSARRPWSLFAQRHQQSSLLNTHSVRMVQGSSNSLPTKANDNSSVPELPHDAWDLLGIYLGHNNCWFPIIPKHEAVRILSNHQDGLDCSEAETVLLWSIFFLAQTLNTAGNPEDATAYTVASSKIPEDEGSISLNYANALLLLGMGKMELGKWETAYLLIGRAVRILLLLRCQTIQDEGKQPSLSDLSDRSVLGAFILDTLTSVYLAVRPHMPSTYVRELLDCSPDGHEEWDQGSWEIHSVTRTSQPRYPGPARVLTIFLQLAKVVAILNDVTLSPEIYEKGYMCPDQIYVGLSRWMQHVPKHCSPHNKPAITVTPPVANLHIIYDGIVQYLRMVVEPTGINSIPGQNVPERLPSARDAYVEAYGPFTSRFVLNLHGMLCGTTRLQPLHLKRKEDNYPEFSQNLNSSRNGLEYGNLSSLGTTGSGLQCGSPNISHMGQGADSQSAQQSASAVGQDSNLAYDYDYGSYAFQTSSSNCLGRRSQTIQDLIEELSKQNIEYGPTTSNYLQDLGYLDVGM